MASVLLTSACATNSSSDSPSSSQEPAAAATTASKATATVSNGAQVKAALDSAFRGRKYMRGAFGSVLPDEKDTLNEMPPGVTSVTFGYACSASSSAFIKLFVNDREISLPAHVQPCDKSVFVYTLPVPPSSTMGFDVTITGPIAGASDAWGVYQA